MRLGSSTSDGSGIGSSSGTASNNSTSTLTADPVIIASHELRRTVSDYDGPCIRLRRSNDNQESDFNFLLSGDLDEASINTFLGANTGYVVTLYDQKGNYDATQATTSLQPIFKNDVGLYIEFTGGAYLRSSSYVGSQSKSSISITWQSPTAISSLSSFVGGIDFSSNQFISPWWTVEQSLTYYNAGSLKYSFIGWEDSSWRHHLITFAEGNIKYFDNGAQANDPESATAPSYSRLTIGKNDFGDADMKFFGITAYDGEVEAQSIFDEVKTYNAFNAVDELIIAMGDSLTTAGFTGLASQWTILGLSNYSSEWCIYSKGGYKLTNFKASVVQSILANKSHTRSTAIIFAGTNDIYLDSTDDATTLARMKDLAQDIRAIGIDIIIVITPLPRFESSTQASIDFEVVRQDFSDLLVNDTSGDFDYVIDSRNIDDIGSQGNQDNDLYYADFVHLTSDGAEVLGQYIQDELSGMLV